MKFSIITPSFNQGRFLEQTILSVLNQTYSNVELIIIDGGSTDNSVDVIRKYENQITYWISEKDSGQSEALNKGLKRASGDVITWLNSDDYFEPDTLERVANKLAADPGCDIIHGTTMLFGDGVKPVESGPGMLLETHNYLSFMRFPQPSSFYKRKVFENCGYLSNDLHYAMDFELVVKALLLGYKIKQTDELLSHYRLHETSKSNHESKFLEEWARVLGNVFYSLDNGSFFLARLQELDLLGGYEPTRYAVSTQFSFEELELVLLDHLHLQYHGNYRMFNKTLCKKIGDYIFLHYPDFYRQKEFGKYNRRLKLIPKFIFGLVRHART